MCLMCNFRELLGIEIKSSICKQTHCCVIKSGIVLTLGRRMRTIIQKITNVRSKVWSDLDGRL